MAVACEFDDTKDRRLRDQILVGLRDSTARELVLRESEPSLEKVLSIVRAAETAQKPTESMETPSMLKKPSEEVCRVEKSRSGKKIPERQKNRTEQKKVQCQFCGREHELKKEKCPAWKKKFNTCGKLNHFASCCKQQKTNLVELGGVFAVGASGPSKKTKTLTVCSTGVKMTFQIDTGASCNVISREDYVRASKDKKLTKVTKKKMTLTTYGGKKWQSLGEVTLVVSVNGKDYELLCVVVEFDAHPLLSLRSSEQLGLVKVLSSDQDKVSACVNEVAVNDKILSQFEDVFTGLGKLEGAYKIVLDKSIPPVIHQPRRVPVAIRDYLKTTLNDFESKGVITKVTRPTEWVSSLTVVKEPNKLRVCLDPKDLNREIRREHYPLPTIVEVASRMKKARKFSALDATNGFWQVELDEESSYLTTFNSPFGRYRWVRMPFGISSAPEVWQGSMLEFAEGLTGVEVIADDFLVTGSGDTDEEAHRDHDKKLQEFLKKARESNMTLNKKKAKLRLPEVTFIGHVLTKEGVKVDPRKVEAVKEMPQPEDVKGVSRFLGMVTYLSKFLPSLSEIAEPLRRLTDDGAEFKWDDDHEKTFKKIKLLVLSAPVLRYYDVTKEVTIQCDASEKGLGAVLLQEGRPVAFSSRAMTPTEQRYAQIEKEMLAIVHACNKFHHYIYGRQLVTVESDHKPLEIIVKKPFDSCPERLQRMLLAVQEYPPHVKVLHLITA